MTGQVDRPAEEALTCKEELGFSVSQVNKLAGSQQFSLGSIENSLGGARLRPDGATGSERKSPNLAVQA